MSPGVTTAVMFGVALLLVFSGLGIGFSLATSAMLVGFFLWGIQSWTLGVSAITSMMQEFTLVAGLCFVFMAMVLEQSGLAEDLFEAMHGWFGRFSGGLAIGVIIICTLFAAMSGISATATMTMGLIALPAMRRRGYSKDMALGPIAAGGALGVLIPPSIMMIIYGLVTTVSIGRLFIGGIFPGLLLSGLFIAYIAYKSWRSPHLAPALPPEEIPSFKKKLVLSRGLVLPILLILAVLGSIFGGIATPTEAAGIGAVGAVICALIHGEFTWRRLGNAGLQSVRLMSAVIWLLVGAKMFAGVYAGVQGRDVVEQLLGPLLDNPILLFVLLQVLFFILGCVMEPLAIIMVFAPVFVPLIRVAGFDQVWFGVLFIVNMQMGFLTPPFGYNLFYLRAVVPPDISMGDIYRAIIPYVILQAIGLILCIVFPQIILWLPGKMMAGVTR